MGRFDGQVVLITGASGGIGAATAVAFAKEGAKLALHGRNKDRLANSARSCGELGAQEVIEIIAEVCNMNELEGIVTRTVEAYGRIDVLINNAGICVIEEFENLQLETYEKIFNTNLRGPVFLSKFALPYLKETKGNIVNISSMFGIQAEPLAIPHSMAKCALDHFTRGLAAECASAGVRVNGINPGVMDKGQKPRLPAGSKPAIMKLFMRANAAQKLGRIPLDTLTESILFLAASTHITGSMLTVDGGYLLH